MPQIEASQDPLVPLGPTGGVARPLRHFGLEEPEVFEEAIRGL